MKIYMTLAFWSWCLGCAFFAVGFYHAALAFGLISILTPIFGDWRRNR